MTLKHAFVSVIADDPASALAGEVVPTNWNADHVLSSADTQVLFNDGGSVGGDAGFTFDKTTNALTLLGPAVMTSAGAAPVGVGQTLNITAADSAGAFVVGISATADTAPGGTQDITAATAVIGGGVSSLGAGRTVPDVSGGIFSAYSSGGGTITNGWGVYGQVSVAGGGIIGAGRGSSSYVYDLGGAPGAGIGYTFYGKSIITSALAEFYGFWLNDSTAAATNPYFLWNDSPGVWRVKADGVVAYYNPAFTKYTPGAANYERIVTQWAANVATIGTEAGGTGTLRALNLIGSALTFNGSPIGGSGTVTHTGALTANALVIGNGTDDIKVTTTGTGIVTALGVNVGSAGAPVVNGGALGTPSSGTLTNCTGLPVAGIAASTVTALGVGSIELGHATNTTLSQSAPGVLAVEGVNVLTTATGLPLSGGTLTGNITLGENTGIVLDPAGSADGKYSGTLVTGTGGATIAFGDLITLDKDDSRWELVDISVAAAATGDARGLLGMAVTTSSDGGALTILLQGIIRADANFPALTIGAAVFASTTGDVVVAQPTTTDHVIRIIGHALTADELFFNPGHVWTTHT